jgi:hypothetical protein
MCCIVYDFGGGFDFCGNFREKGIENTIALE